MRNISYQRIRDVKQGVKFDRRYPVKDWSPGLPIPMSTHKNVVRAHRNSSRTLGARSGLAKMVEAGW